MIARFFFIGILSLFSIRVSAQDDVLTTFILIRHAEKEGQNAMASSQKDPKLSAEGLKRADKLVALFSKAEIGAIYSTPFIRTKSTVEPLAQSKSLPILEYEPNNLELIDQMRIDHIGKTIVVCGHSNTIPKIANYLTKSGKFKDFHDSDYSNILIVTVSSSQKNNTVTWLNY
jgi:broad specificity phosphatase PhoE